jgi:hypothetical protein
MAEPVTKIRVTLKDGVPQNTNRRIPEPDESRWRLNVYTADGIIVQVDNVD